MSVQGASSVAPPGWYADPADATRLRRWDGAQWTQEVRVDEPPAPAVPIPARPAVSIPVQPAVSVPVEPVASVPAQPVTAPTTARPTPAPGQRQSTPTGPVSLPEWATLPGLTLPPDLSAIPGLHSDSVLGMPTFAEPQTGDIPVPPVAAPPASGPPTAGPPADSYAAEAERPDPQGTDPQGTEVAATRAAPEPEPAHAPDTPAEPYAPPPVGVQYDVPPPPGMARVPAPVTILPPSAFVPPQPLSAGWPALPPVGSGPTTPFPYPASAPEAGHYSLSGFAGAESRIHTSTFSSWLIALLPLLQFGAIYLVFKTLAVELAPGMQWGVLAAPAAFSLLFANADRKKLDTLGARSPSIVLALIPPLYLFVRCFTAGRSSVAPLLIWLILQAGAAAGVYFLLPDLLAAGIKAIG